MQGKKWPDPRKDELIFIENPIEAEMPSHWLPSSIVKAIMEGSVPVTGKAFDYYITTKPRVRSTTLAKTTTTEHRKTARRSTTTLPESDEESTYSETETEDSNEPENGTAEAKIITTSAETTSGRHKTTPLSTTALDDLDEEYTDSGTDSTEDSYNAKNKTTTIKHHLPNSGSDTDYQPDTIRPNPIKTTKKINPKPHKPTTKPPREGNVATTTKHTNTKPQSDDDIESEEESEEDGPGQGEEEVKGQGKEEGNGQGGEGGKGKGTKEDGGENIKEEENYSDEDNGTQSDGSDNNDSEDKPVTKKEDKPHSEPNLSGGKHSSRESEKPSSEDSSEEPEPSEEETVPPSTKPTTKPTTKKTMKTFRRPKTTGSKPQANNNVRRIKMSLYQ